jgi:hypothetical protein
VLHTETYKSCRPVVCIQDPDSSIMGLEESDERIGNSCVTSPVSKTPSTPRGLKSVNGEFRAHPKPGLLANRKLPAACHSACCCLGSTLQAKHEVSTASPSDLWTCLKCIGPMLIIESLTEG